MPKVKANKSRVHHKAVGNKDALAAVTTAASAVASKPVVAAGSESMQQMKDQFGLEFEEDRIDKKDKRKLRHDKWISKLEATYNPQKKKKKSAQQSQTLSVDFGSFHDVLSTIDPIQSQAGTTALSSSAAAAALASSKSGSKFKNSGKAAPVPVSAANPSFTINADSSKPLQSKKAKKKAAMQEILRFQNVLAHPAFKSNPMLTIQQHVKNTMEMAPPEPTAITTGGGPELMED
ncbi:ribosome biogenesis protein SLX9-domain-containing protein [Gamsiella multidivaricata]|uniref:ribosome biogenesis protein SLX9-domain-containing protein n=1 Tax=Gamsiella multidivaricata TaxID=101098 RepID=UPI002220E2DE|nr:ribosome biogenesis protein SLX9-domain-containing protein [Gamsiella multidivaricata]KAG0351198.1 hypothetical protein BGZ54_003380 [Gamsiella multidivaricata]KAI7832370.1 ribosome biogenesis protein SLX9-domain-containing protein [Gamsiella multidivaricata]